MTGYIRQDLSNEIANGNVIDADILDDEFNAVVAAFNASTGHTHDGTAAEGAPITVVGPTQDLIVSAGSVLPKTDNTLDLGSGTFEFKDLYIDGTANIDALVADTADINGGTIDATVIGATTPAAITATTVTATSLVGTLTGGITGNAATATALQTSRNITLSGDVSGTAAFNGTADASIVTTVADNSHNHLLANVTDAGTMAAQNSGSVSITGGSITGITDLAIADGGTGASTAPAALINLGLTATAAEINVLDGIPVGLTATELGYVDGVTSSIQTQLNAKQASDPFLDDISALTDPNADRILFWDDSLGDITWLTVGTGLTLSGTTLTADSQAPADGSITFAKLDPTAVITEAEGISANDNDTTIPTSAAVKDYVDNAVGGGNALTWDTVQATTSGSTKDFTAPFAPKRITVSLQGVNGGAANLGIRLGDAGGIETSGYTSQYWTLTTAGSISEVTATDRYLMTTASGTWTGNVILTNVTGNVWVLSAHLIDESGGTNLFFSGGSKELSAALTTVRLLTAGTFSAGQVNVLWE